MNKLKLKLKNPKYYNYYNDAILTKVSGVDADFDFCNIVDKFNQDCLEDFIEFELFIKE